ncbi:MAG: hypothetical protein IJM90_04575 [Firmicutes bacterium]|nr:hypothetical protein [Bacillota bacterium]
MKIVDLDDDRNCFCGDNGDYENWNIDPEAIIEIVRCKYCKYYCTGLFCKKWADLHPYAETYPMVSSNGFCHFGERRIEDDET